MNRFTNLLCAISLGFCASVNADLESDIRLNYTNAGLTDEQIKSDIKKLAIKAKDGNADTQFELAIAYLLVDDWEHSHEWLRKAAEQDHAASIYMIGYFHYMGEHMSKNRALARQLWEMSAELGNPEAMYALGSMHITGETTKKDLATGFEFLKKSYGAGFSLAYSRIGMTYVTEPEIRDLKKAFYYFCEAAHQNEGNAQTFVGHYYNDIIKSDFIQKNTETALFWYLSASRQFKPLALKFVSSYYLQGIAPIAKDSITGTAWLTLAYNHGNSSLKPQLNGLVGNFDDKQLDQYNHVFYQTEKNIEDKKLGNGDLVNLKVPTADCREDYPAELYSSMKLETKIKR